MVYYVKMVLCRMNILGFCTVLCLMIIYGVDVCDAECGEYIVIFEQTTCRNKDKYEYKLRPLTKDEIDRNNLTYPCNSTNKDQEKRKCLIEYDCMGTQSRCQRHVIPNTFQTHSFIADSLIATPTVYTTEAIGLLTTATDTHTVTPVEITTKAVGLSTTTNDTHTVTPVESTTEAVGVINHITNVYEVFNQTMYDVNIIYIQNSSERTNETLKPRNQVFQCKYAEIVCKNNSLRDIKNSTNDTHRYEPPETLQIEISRDETSSVQPLFTGYFPESSNAANFNNNFDGVMNTLCSIQKDSNCKQNIDSLKYINIYFETNYVENNTITKYPNCTKDLLTSKNELIVKCEDISFAKHNQHILQGPPQKQELWNCQITEFKNSSSSKEQRQNNRIHFVNCSNETKIIDIKTKEINVVPNVDIKNISGLKTNIDISSQTNLEKNITILITEKPNKCGHNTSLNINKGKIIDLGLNNSKEMTIQNNNLDIILSNCVHDPSAKINNIQPLSRTELIIILKNESMNTSDLKQFNGTLNDESVKQRILLLCNQSILNITMNTTELHCESIDLVFYNITGIEITPSSQITSKKIAIKPQTEKKQELATWYCIIIEEQQKNKLGFGNCSNNMNIKNKNKSRENNVTAISDKNTEIPSGKLEQNKDSLLQPKHIIKIDITEKGNNCNNNSFLSIDGGKIIDLGVYKNKEEILKNNNVELKLSDCINIKSSIINETQVDLTDLTIILKTESLKASDLQQFNGTPEERNVKQRILLRCDLSNHDYNINTTSNMTVLLCQSVDLELYNITGIEIITNLTQSSHVNATNHFSTNQTVEKNDSIVNNNMNENKTTHIDYKGVQKNITEPKILKQNINRRKDIPDDMEQNSLALQNAEPEKILLIALLSIVGASILIVIVLRVCTKKKEYNPAPTREPPDDEETAF